MKKVKVAGILLFLVFSLLLLVCPAYAQENEVVEDALEETFPLAEDVSQESEVDFNAETPYNVFTRLWEFVVNHKNTLLDALSLCLLLAVSIFESKARKKTGVSLSSSFSRLFAGTSAVSDSQNAVVNVANDLIRGYEQMCRSNDDLHTSFEEMKKVEEDRDKVVGALALEVSAVLEILTGVYTNSKNLPQGVKDIVNLRYAKCLTALESDDALHNCIEAVRSTIGVGEREESKEA